MIKSFIIAFLVGILLGIMKKRANKTRAEVKWM